MAYHFFPLLLPLLSFYSLSSRTALYIKRRRLHSGNSLATITLPFTASYLLSSIHLPMEAFNLLKFWRNYVSDNNAGADVVSDDTDSLNNSTKYTDDGHNPASETDYDSDEESFFDLVLDGADYFCMKEKSKAVNVISKCESGFNFPESPKDVFLKENAFSVDSKLKVQSPISLLRAAPKFRVFFLGLKKSKQDSSESPSIWTPKPRVQSKRFVDDVEIAASMPSRENSLRSRLQMEKFDDPHLDEPLKRSAKNAVPKYLKLIKPLYGKSSKQTEKSNPLADKISVTSALSPVRETIASARRLSEERQGSRAAGFSAMRKHLVKSRSAGAASPPVRRRDDSLLEQNDGIQSAILHCKASYNSLARGGGSSLLSRSISEPHHKDLQRRCCDDLKRCSI